MRLAAPELVKRWGGEIRQQLERTPFRAGLHGERGTGPGKSEERTFGKLLCVVITGEAPKFAQPPPFNCASCRYSSRTSWDEQACGNACWSIGFLAAATHLRLQAYAWYPQQDSGFKLLERGLTEIRASVLSHDIRQSPGVCVLHAVYLSTGVGQVRGTFCSPHAFLCRACSAFSGRPALRKAVQER